MTTFLRISSRILLFCFWLAQPLAAADGGAKIWGLELCARDVAANSSFYQALGFETLRGEAGTWELLRNDRVALVISASSRGAAPLETPRIYLNFSVGDLDRAAQTVREHGGSVATGPPIETPIGLALEATDPAGHPLHLIDHPNDELTPDDTPVIFNLGMTTTRLDADEQFLTQLGFTVATRDYLPATLVFEHRGASYLVVHPHPDAKEVTSEEEIHDLDGGRLLLHTLAPGPLLTTLRTAGLDPDRGRMPAASFGHGTLDFTSPTGLEVSVDRRPPISTEDERRAQAAFERFKGLAGRWRAESTHGWSEEVSYEIAARGSAVIGRTRFKDAPDRAMATFFVLDGTRLVVTHVCEATNQPRLEATRISEDASEVEITFLDATALVSRDHGHMDRAVYRFDGPDRFSSRWTWYQDGEEGWMEEITYVRLDESRIDENRNDERAAANAP